MPGFRALWSKEVRAHVNVDYDQSFLLSEEYLVKIDEFIRKRAEGVPNFQLKYEVARSDHAMLTYEKPGIYIHDKASQRDYSGPA